MKIGIIQASSQIEKNGLIYDTAIDVVEQLGHEVINFGCFEQEEEKYSYIEIALEVSLLLSSGAVDFMITGCSSGQGMMLACNSLPGVICGYVENPQDAFLFGRINDGNAVSLPLGLNFGWAGEINLKCTLEKLFDGAFGEGYPKKDADRKKKDTILLKKLNSMVKKNMISFLEELNQDLLEKMIQKENVITYILEHGTDKEIINFLEKVIHKN